MLDKNQQECLEGLLDGWELASESAEEFRPEEECADSAVLNEFHKKTQALIQFKEKFGGGAGPATVTGFVSGTPNIPGFEFKEIIGRGGMGEVWSARQKEPVERDVAIKLIRQDVCSEYTYRKFDSEAQTLALMEHENIARVYDAGKTDSGSPYLVMELIDGLGIDEYCDLINLDSRMRLQLLLPVCRAINHAHQKGVIHRDIKPSNILISTVDGKAVPKVIDFGLAKALEADQVRGHSFETEFGRIVGTIHFMSPEQTGFQNLDIDTRTDVYSLGVLIYKLMTGQTPYEMLETDSSSWLDAVRFIQESDPLRPSYALRKSQSSHLSKIEEDIDWIILKCLEKDRDRRYQSPADLADDILRFLENRPVLAHAPSFRYRFGKLVSRNRFVAAATALLLATLVTATIVSIRYGYIANQARLQAEIERVKAQQTSIENRQLAEQAQNEKAIAIAAKDFLLNNFLQQSNPWENPILDEEGKIVRFKNLTIEQLVEKAEEDFNLETIKDVFPGQPAVQAEVLETIGDIYEGFGDREKALRYAQGVHQILEKEFGGLDRSTLRSLTTLGFAQLASGQKKSALTTFFDVFSRLEKLSIQPPVQGEDIFGNAVDAVFVRIKERIDPGRRVLPIVSDGFSLLDVPWQYFLVFERLRKFSERLAGRYGEEDQRTIYARLMIAFVYHAINNIETAMQKYEELYATAKQMVAKGTADQDDLGFIALKQVLVVCYENQNINREQQIELGLSVLESMIRKYGKANPGTIVAMNNLASTYFSQSKFKLAASYLADAVAQERFIFGEHSPNQIFMLLNLAKCHEKLRQFDEALKVYEKARSVAVRYDDTVANYFLTLQEKYCVTLVRLNRLDKAAKGLAEYVTKVEQANLRIDLKSVKFIEKMIVDLLPTHLNAAKSSINRLVNLDDNHFESRVLRDRLEALGKKHGN